MFDETNVIVKAFRMAKDKFVQTDFLLIRLKLLGDRFDKRYFEPAVSEIVGFIVGDVDELINRRDVIVDHKSVGLQRISDLHPAFMAMQYPILFPYGEDGFHLGIKYRSCLTRAEIKRGNVTAKELYSYVIQQRLGQGKTLLKGGKLFHQYVVDAFTSIEGMRLEYIKKNKKNLEQKFMKGLWMLLIEEIEMRLM